MTNLATQPQSNRAHFYEDIDRIRALDAPEPIKTVREMGATQFDKLDYPHHRQEEWRFTNIAPIVRTPYRTIVGEPARALNEFEVAPYLYDEANWTQLVFVDGLFAPHLSRIVAEAATVGENLATMDTASASGRHLNRWIKASNIYVALNSACLQDGACISVPPNTVLDHPIHCVYISTSIGPHATHPRTLIHVGPSSEAAVIETFVGAKDSSGYLTNAVAEIVIEDNARLHRHKVVQEAKDARHLSAAQVRLGRDARLESFVITLSGQIVRNELNVLLDGENAECGLDGLYLNDGDRLIDNALFVEHGKPHCRSRMGYKGILDGKSTAVFTGKVLVPRHSQKTDSNQLNQNLLLSDEATIDSKPQLEIFADDVKCTHGATVGAFPQQLVFYFQSRGMSEAMARGILTYGFAGEVVGEIGIDALRARIDAYVFDKYSPNPGKR